MARKPASDIRVFTVDQDKVVNAIVATGRTNYKYALGHLTKLVDRLHIQRRIQNTRFYDRLRRDLLKGCLMPPITLAYVRKNFTGLTSPKKLQAYVRANIGKAFVLDGIQRLSSLKRAYEEDPQSLPLNQSLFINVLICKSTDNLLYRMITLNNGQRPMTARHQIEILSQNLFQWKDNTLTLATEKDGVQRQQLVFNKADFVLAYMAFLSNSTTIDSQKLIQEKLDELVAEQILEKDPTQSSVEFSQVVELIGRLSKSERIDTWFKVSNNLIGFCAGITNSFDDMHNASTKSFVEFILNFENTFADFDVSKIKLGRARRSAVAYAIKHYKKTSQASKTKLTELLIDVIE